MVHRFSHDLYFESAAMILTLVTLGKFFETRSKGETGRAIEKLMDLEPKTACVLRDGEEKTVLEGKVAEAVTVPFTMGGGISSVQAAADVLAAGADKISTSSAVFRNPDMIGELVKEFGKDKVTVAIDVAQNANMASGYEVFIDGGRTATGTDAIEWTKKVADYGVGTILPTSKSTDGVRTGYDLPLIRKIREITDADIVASGGAGTMEHFAEAAEAGATVLLAASVFHFHVIGIPELKAFLKDRGFSVRI